MRAAKIHHQDGQCLYFYLVLIKARIPLLGIIILLATSSCWERYKIDAS